MRASGNGAVGVCVNNLLRIFRGENPYERVKGLDPRIIDRPVMDAQAEATQEAQWCIENYEPRVNLESVTVTAADAPGGDFKVSAYISEA